MTGKGKGGGKNNGGKQQQTQQQANVAQGPTSNTTTVHQKPEQNPAEEGWSKDWSSWYAYDAYTTMDTTETTLPETGIQLDIQRILSRPLPTLHEDGQTDQNNCICYHVCCWFRIFGHGLMSFMFNMFQLVTLLYHCCVSLCRTEVKSIRSNITSDACSSHRPVCAAQHPLASDTDPSKSMHS